MKTYIIRGGHTIYETYEISVEAKDEHDAQSKAEKIPLEKWDDLQQENGGDFVIDSVWEDRWKL